MILCARVRRGRLARRHFGLPIYISPRRPLTKNTSTFHNAKSHCLQKLQYYVTTSCAKCDHKGGKGTL